MANWEFENDSTTNYLRAQDKVAQNPIDFYEDGTLEAPAVHAEQGSLSAGGTFIIYERDGVYYANNVNGSPEYSNSTPNLGALINDIVADENPAPGIKSNGDGVSIQLILEPKNKPYKMSTTPTIYNGTRFALRSPGQQGALIKYTGDPANYILHYDGSESQNIQNAKIGHKANAVSINNIGFLWADDRSQDSIYLRYVNTVDIRNVFAQYTSFDLTDRVKAGETVPDVPSGPSYFIYDESKYSEYRTYENIWVVGSEKALYSSADHGAIRNLQIFYGNPPSDSQNVYIGGVNDYTVTNLHVYECAGSTIAINSGGSSGITVNGVAFEDTPPSGYNSQTAVIDSPQNANITLSGVQNSANATTFTSTSNTTNITYPGKQGTGSELYLSSNQTVPDTSLTPINWAAVADPNGYYDGTNDVWVVPEPGDYSVEYALFPNTAFTSGTRRLINLTLNGTEIRKCEDYSQGQNTLFLSVTLKQLSKGDELQTNFFQASGSSVDVKGGKVNTWLSVTKAR